MIPKGHWTYKKNQKAFFDQLAIKWNIQKTEDWNKVTKDMILKEGGSFITNYYNGSLRQGKTIEDSQIVCYSVAIESPIQFQIIFLEIILKIDLLLF
jgi:hypothetical protein